VHQFDNRRASLYASIRRQIQEGRQVYIVYPLIKESEKMDIKNLEDGYAQVCAEFTRIPGVHGAWQDEGRRKRMPRCKRLCERRGPDNGGHHGHRGGE